jgi:hypothetical protein
MSLILKKLGKIRKRKSLDVQASRLFLFNLPLYFNGFGISDNTWRYIFFFLIQNVCVKRAASRADSRSDKSASFSAEQSAD